MALVLKIDLEGDVRRFRITIPENADIETKWAMIQDEVRLGYQLAQDSSLTMKYRDEDGDMCTLVQETLPDCLLQAASGTPMRLIASKSSAAPEGPAAAAATPSAGAPAEMDPEKMMEMMWAMKKMWKAKMCAEGKDGGWHKWWHHQGAPGQQWAAWHNWHHCRQQHKAGHCPAGHELATRQLPRITCDVCHTALGGAASMGCAMCDWDICEACTKAKAAEEEPKHDADAKPKEPEQEVGSDGEWSWLPEAHAHEEHWGAAPTAETADGFMKGHCKGFMKGMGKGKAKGFMKGMGKGFGPFGGKGFFGGKGMFGKGHCEPGMWEGQEAMRNHWEQQSKVWAAHAQARAAHFQAMAAHAQAHAQAQAQTQPQP